MSIAIEGERASHCFNQLMIAWLLLIVSSGCFAAVQGSDSNKVYDFDIKSQTATLGLAEFAKTTDQVLLYQFDAVSPFRTNAVRGLFSSHAALEALLEGTGLIADFSERGNVIIKNEMSGGSNDMTDNNLRKRPIAAMLSAMLGIGVVAPSMAQTEQAQAMEEVVVTGTHIRRGDQQFSISPLKSLGADDIAVQGAKDVTDIIRNLTINTGSELNVSGLNQPQTAGTAQINLRGLGLGSTLVLVNGRRQTLSAVAK